MITTKEELRWKVHTASLLHEVLNNTTTSALRIPLIIFRNLLAEVAERAIQLNDPKLNALMMRLALYSVADPSSQDFKPELVERTIIDAKGADKK